MKTWTRTQVATLCGGCNALVAFNLPILAIQLPNVKRVRYRCEKCAGEAPPDLPFHDAPAQKRTSRMKPIGTLAADFKLAQAGD